MLANSKNALLKIKLVESAYRPTSVISVHVTVNVDHVLWWVHRVNPAAGIGIVPPYVRAISDNCKLISIGTIIEYNIVCFRVYYWRLFLQKSVCSDWLLLGNLWETRVSCVLCLIWLLTGNKLIPLWFSDLREFWPKHVLPLIFTNSHTTRCVYLLTEKHII